MMCNTSKALYKFIYRHTHVRLNGHFPGKPGTQRLKSITDKPKLVLRYVASQVSLTLLMRFMQLHKTLRTTKIESLCKNASGMHKLSPWAACSPGE